MRFLLTALLSLPALAYGQGASVAASFTIPDNVLQQTGKILILNQDTEERKKQFLGALGAIDEAIQRIKTPQAQGVSSSVPSSPALPKAITTVADTLNPIALTPYPHYAIQKQALLDDLITATSKTEQQNMRLLLARLNITFGRAEEAIGILENFPKHPQNKMPHHALARILLGIAYSLNGEAKTALPLLTKSGEPRAHRLLWKAYTLDQLAAKSTHKSEKEAQEKQLRALFEDGQELITTYPAFLAEKLTQTYAKNLLDTPEETQNIITLFKTLTDVTNQPLTPESTYILSQAYELTGNSNKSLQLLADVAESKESPIAFQAKYDFINRLQRRGEISNAVTIKALEALSRLWRGDKLEEKILLDLGRLYLAEKNYRQALNYLKDYSRYYPEGTAREQVAYLMTRNFLSAFNEKNALLTDDLGFLSLYYDFRELTPADSRGDKLITRVASRLERLNLFSQAQNLFEQQLTFRTNTPDEMADLTLKLSRLHRKNNDTKSALELLGNIDVNALSAPMRDDITLERAQVYIQNGNYADAKPLLKTIQNDAARDLLIDIAWLEDDSPELIRLMAPIFVTGEHGGFESEQVRNHFTKLAYAYAKQQDTDAISRLKKDFPEVIKDYPEIADAIAFATARGGAQEVRASQTRPVGQLAIELSKINALFTNYNDISKDVTTRKAAREIFNKKMRYMELKQQGRL